MKIDFAYEKTSTKSRFEKETRGNSEMAYSSPVTCSASVTFGKEPSTDQVVDAAILDCLYRIQDGGPIRLARPKDTPEMQTSNSGYVLRRHL